MQESLESLLEMDMCRSQALPIEIVVNCKIISISWAILDLHHWKLTGSPRPREATPFIGLESEVKATLDGAVQDSPVLDFMQLLVDRFLRHGLP